MNLFKNLLLGSRIDREHVPASDQQKAKELLTNNLQFNLNKVQEIIGNSSELTIKQFRIGDGSIPMAVVYTDGLADKQLLDNFVLEPLMGETKQSADLHTKLLTHPDPWVLLLMFILIVLLLPQMEMSRMQPVLEEGIKPVLLGSLPATFLPSMENLCLLLLIPHIKDNKKIRKNFLIGALIGSIALNIIVTQSILVLGEYMTADVTYSTYTLAKQINIGTFLQRVEAIITFLWIITSYVKAALYFYALNIGLAQFIKLKAYKMLTIPTAMICFWLIFVSIPNTAYFKYVSIVWGYYDLSICLVIPLFLIGLYFIRKK